MSAGRRARSRSRTSPTSTAAASTSCPSLLERAISEINDLAPDIVVCSGDLTTFGFKHEYEQARRYLDQVECEASSSSRATTTRATSATSTSSSSSATATRCCASARRHGRRGRLDRARPRPRPDRPRPLPLDRGAVRRGGRPTCASSSATTTCCPCRARAASATSIYDAGDTIECLQRAGVHLVLSGHKHVPYAWRLENLFVVNTGTVSSLRLRGQHEALLQRRRGSRAATSPSGASTRSTARSGSSSSRSTRSSTRSTRRGSRTR